jgi:peptide/nickel transport system ATP-binding protein
MSSIQNPVLDISGLTVALPAGGDRAFAVQGLDLSIGAGQTVCVVGESGSGKSVLATTVMGLLPKSLKAGVGSIKLMGEELLGAPESRLRALRGLRMGMVFQEPMTALNPVMRCGDQVDELLREHTDWPARNRRARILEVFEQVRLPDPARIYASYPHQLSGGQRQRIVIAMAVIMKPSLLICDEPTTALDVTTQKEILKLIADLHRSQGCAVLFITHDMGVVEEIADRVVVMLGGRCVEQGTCAEVLRAPREAYTRDLLAAVPGMTPPRPSAEPLGEALLRASGVGKAYVSHDWLGRRREVVALQDAALSVRAGETIGVVGESGSGKSTFARCLVRLIDPTVGQIHWGAYPVQSLRERALRPLRSNVQVVFQDPNRSLNPRLRVVDSLVEGAVNFGVPRAQALRRAEELMTLVRLPVAGLTRYPSEFSGGQRQRLAIARAIACSPRVLVADEAVSALDVSVQAEILKLLREVQARLGLGIVFITHDLRVAAQLCRQVVVMHRGRIVEQGLTAEVYARPQHDYTRTLLAAAPGWHAAATTQS